MMNEHAVITLPVRVRADDGISPQRPDLGVRVTTVPPAAVRPGPEVARLQQVLEDVRFSLERGSWQAALATVHAALDHDAGNRR